MKRISTAVLAAMFLATLDCNCGGGGGNSDSGGNNPDGSYDGGSAAFGFQTLVPGPNELTFVAMAIRSDDTIGVAYFQRTDGGIDASIPLPDGGFDNTQTEFNPNYDISYVEWSNGNVTQPQVVRTVQKVYGVTVAFQPNGQPAVAYLGGADVDMNPYWFQEGACVNFRQADSTTWTEEQVDQNSADDLPPAIDLPDSVDNQGMAYVNGLAPSLIFADGGTAWLAYRDVHYGQFPKQDWGGSDLKIATGSPGSWTLGGVAWGGNNKRAYGGHNQLVVGLNGNPAVITDQLSGGPSGGGQNVLFFEYQPGAPAPGWVPNYVNAPLGPPLGGIVTQQIATPGDDQFGPSMVFDDPSQQGGIGYAVTFFDFGTGALSFMSSTDGATWSSPDTFFQFGSGGWYPSVAVDPVLHTPSVAFVFCSPESGITDPSQCPPGTEQVGGAHLQIAYQVGGNWRFLVVDPDGWWQPHIGFLSTGQRVVVYNLQDGTLRLALEH